MHRIRPFLLTAFVLAFAAPAVAQGPETCTVAFVVDGDTLNCADGTVVRLLLVDAPDGGRFGDLSRRALSRLARRGAVLRLETDVETRDPHDRLLAYAFTPDGQMVNEILLRLGYAFLHPSPPNDRYAARLRAAEMEARERNLGVWAG